METFQIHRERSLNTSENTFDIFTNPFPLSEKPGCRCVTLLELMPSKYIHLWIKIGRSVQENDIKYVHPKYSLPKHSVQSNTSPNVESRPTQSGWSIRKMSKLRLEPVAIYVWKRIEFDHLKYVSAEIQHRRERKWNVEGSVCRRFQRCKLLFHITLAIRTNLFHPNFQTANRVPLAGGTNLSRPASFYFLVSCANACRAIESAHFQWKTNLVGRER